VQKAEDKGVRSHPLDDMRREIILGHPMANHQELCVYAKIASRHQSRKRFNHLLLSSWIVPIPHVMRVVKDKDITAHSGYAADRHRADAAAADNGKVIFPGVLTGNAGLEDLPVPRRLHDLADLPDNVFCERLVVSNDHEAQTGIQSKHEGRKTDRTYECLEMATGQIDEKALSITRDELHKDVTDVFNIAV
jgi:hypothetical protein